MTRIKRLVSALLLAVLMVSAFGTAAFASDGGEEETVKDESLLCPNCGQATMVQQPTVYGDWHIMNRTPCNHGDFWGWDEVHQRKVLTTYTCKVCIASSEYTSDRISLLFVDTEEQILHHKKDS